MTSPWLWYANRGTGLVLLLLLTATVVLGMTATARNRPRVTSRLISQGVHRNLGLFAVCLLAVHVTTAVVDSYVTIRWWDALVPFAGQYRPLWLGFGTVAFDLMVAVAVTSWLRGRLPLRTWRAVHWLAYPLWASSVIHGLGIGTDRAAWWGLAVTVGCVLAVLSAGAWRLSALEPARGAA